MSLSLFHYMTNDPVLSWAPFQRRGSPASDSLKQAIVSKQLRTLLQANRWYSRETVSFLTRYPAWSGAVEFVKQLFVGDSIECFGKLQYSNIRLLHLVIAAAKFIHGSRGRNQTRSHVFMSRCQHWGIWRNSLIMGLWQRNVISWRCKKG